MKRFSRKSFSQIMISNLLKDDLDQLKIIINKKSDNCSQSYGDVISYLVNKLKQNSSINKKKYYYNIKSGLFVSIPLKKINLNVSYGVSP